MDKTKIEWTNHTFNPWSGCTNVSEGCRHCYAASMSERRLPTVPGRWGKNGSRVVASQSYWEQPRIWNQAALVAGERRQVFCASVADVFEGATSLPPASIPEIEAARKRLFELIRDTAQLDWLLLTKRPENILGMWHGEPLGNVWLGTSVEDNRVRYRIEQLRESRHLSRHIFLSIEPMIGPVDADLSGIDWVIVGGESGPKARPVEPQWIRAVRDQCIRLGIPFFFKQWSGLGVKKLGRLLDGREWNQIPGEPL